MAFTRREAQIRDEILSALANHPNRELVAPYVIRQLCHLCNFPGDSTNAEIEAILRKMANANQITLDMTRVAVWKVALALVI